MEWQLGKEEGKNYMEEISILADNCKVYFPDHIYIPYQCLLYHRRTPPREGIKKLRNLPSGLSQ